MKPAAIDVRIDELVLRGFPATDRVRIGAATQRELARLLSERRLAPVLTQPRDVARLRGVTFPVTWPVTAETLGAQIAGSVHRRLGEGGTR